MEQRFKDDPAYRTMLEGLGLALGEKPKAPDRGPEKPSIGRTVSDTLKFADEKRATEAATPPEPPKPGDAAPAPAPEATPAPAPEPPPAPTPGKPVEVEKRKPVDKIVEDAIRKVIGEKPAPTPAAPAPAAPAVPAADPFEATLNDDERDAMNFARYAAEKNPEKYGSLPAKQLAFFKEVDGYIRTARTQNPERVFDESDAEFMRFIQQNKPKLDQRDRKTLERQQIVEEAEQRASEKMRKETDELRRETHVLKTKPIVEQAVQTFTRESEDAIANDANSPAAPIVKAAREKGWDNLLKEDQVFAPIVRHYQNESVRLASIYESAVAGLVEFRPDVNRDHEWLHTFVTRRAADFKQNGGEGLVRGEKTFLTPKEFSALRQSDPAKVAQHWTFDDRDVLTLLADNTRWNMNEALKREEQRLAASGFQRSAKPQLPKTENPPTPPTPSPTPPPTPTASPRAVSSAAPGAAKGGGPSQHQTAMTAGELAALGLPTS
jgi:hypothetical protein